MRKLTFGISCYNFENYIERCVDSVMSQRTNFDFDVVIRDDCSTDGSRLVLDRIREKYSGRRNLKILMGEENVGTNENVRILLSECKGEYISLLDGDDCLCDDDKLQRQVDFLDSRPEYAMHCTSYRYMDREGVVTTPMDVWMCAVKDEVSLEDLLEQNFISFGRTFRNAGISDRLNAADYYRDFIYDDWALNFEILKVGKAFCDLYWVTGLYRITGTGVITSNSEQVIHSRNIECRNKLLSEFERYRISQQ